MHALNVETLEGDGVGRGKKRKKKGRSVNGTRTNRQLYEGKKMTSDPYFT